TTETISTANLDLVPLINILPAPSPFRGSRKNRSGNRGGRFRFTDVSQAKTVRTTAFSLLRSCTLAGGCADPIEHIRVAETREGALHIQRQCLESVSGARRHVDGRE